MSIRVTVSSNYGSDRSRRVLKDVETEKRNEWNRRRLLRIQQVRQQSKDFANSLREKIHGEGDYQKENNNKQWQDNTLDRLTEKYRDCLKDIGLAHAKAARQPDPDEILREERIRNEVLSGIRGESAMCLLKCRQQMRKLEETVPTRLKAFVRAKEDLRSTMVASLPYPQPRPKKSPVKKKCSPVKRRVVATKQKKPRHVLKEIPSNLPVDYVTVIERVPDDDKLDKCCGSGNINDDLNVYNRQELSESPKYKCHCSPKEANATQPPETKAAKTTHQNRKDVEEEEAGCPKNTRRQRRYSDACHVSDLEDNYDSDTTWPPRSRRSSSSGHVLCYDHGNRHHSTRPAPSMSSYVKRVGDEDVERTCLRSAHEEDMRVRQCEEKCREERMKEQAKRGEEAQRRQQRRNDFDRLMLELSKLNREERKLRYTNWTKGSTELGDTQRKMATKTRQKKIESAFEMEFMDSITEDENKEKPVGTPKLNVAEWKKNTECVAAIEVSRAKQNDKLTLSNLMKRINEQREMLFQEISNEADDGNGAGTHSLPVGRTEKSDGKVQDNTDSFNNQKTYCSTTTNMQNVGAKYNPYDSTAQNTATTKNIRILEDTQSSRQETRYQDDLISRGATKRGSLEATEATKYPISGYRSAADSHMPRVVERGPCFCGSTVEKFCKCSTKVDVIKQNKEEPIAPVEPSKSCLEEKEPCFCGANVGKSCLCSENSGVAGENSTYASTGNAHRRMRPIRLPSPILEVSETSYKQDSREFDATEAKEHSAGKSSMPNKVGEEQNISEESNKKPKKDCGRLDKVVEKQNVSEEINRKSKNDRERVEDNVGSSDKNSDSSLSTLYSLDMALSQVAVEKNDDKDDGSSTNMKGLRITVKVTGGKEYKDKKRKKTKTEEEKLLKECTKLLEDKGNMRKRNLSGETTSTSYRSPPDRLSPKQLQLLRDLLKQIEGKPDEKGMPLLKRYILRLLSMNRESINCLGVSSSDVSLQSSLMREMVGNLEDSSNTECDDATLKHTSCKEKGVQVSLVENSTKNESRKQGKNRKVDSTNPLERTDKDYEKQKRNSRLDSNLFEDSSNDKKGKQKRSKRVETHQQAPSAVDGHYRGVTADDASLLDDLDVLTEQINKYFEAKQNDKSDEIVKKYMELAKRYTDRISNLADLIGDVETDVPSSLIRSRTDQESVDSTKSSPVKSSEKSSFSLTCSQTYNETSYMTLPPEVKVPLPSGRVEPLQRISPTFPQDKKQDISWHEALSQLLPTRISPAPDEARLFRPKPPPTILNNHNSYIDPDLRTSSPHELSTIHEADTPSTSWRRDIPQMATSSPRKRSYQPSHQDSGYRISQPDESIPLHNTPPGLSRNHQKASDESFQTLKTEDNSEFSELDFEGENILDESMPDVMQELIRRNIVSSPYGWLKEMQEREGTAQDVADEEVRRIMRQSPEDLEAALKNLGIGWASTTLRKTRQAGELSGNSSSPSDARPIGTNFETSTPKSSKSQAQALPVIGSETEISAIPLIASSSSDLALTPPDISLKPPQLPSSSNSSDT